MSPNAACCGAWMGIEYVVCCSVPGGLLPYRTCQLTFAEMHQHSKGLAPKIFNALPQLLCVHVYHIIMNIHGCLLAMRLMYAT